MRISKNLVSASKYNIKCPYAMKAKFIVVHNTANDASAANEIAYMIRNNNQVSFHYAVDDIEVVQGIPENRNTWHAGDGGNGRGNRNGIAVEICYSRSGGEKFIKAEQNAAKFIAMKLKEKGWGIDKVKKHQDFAKKYCPHRTLDRGWNRFLNIVKQELNKTVKTPTQTSNNELYKVRKSWNDAKTQKGAFKNLNNAKRTADKNKGYKVYSPTGVQVYPQKSIPVNKPTDTWRKYISGQEVRNLQVELNKQFNKGVKVDGYFGDEMERKCNVNVKRGAKGNMTRIIQRRLIAKGCRPSYGVDGSFGSSTYNMVVKFQKSNGLSADGIVGKSTWKALFRK